MNTHIACVTKAAHKLNLNVKKIDKDGLFVEVTDGKKSEYFVQQVPPLNTMVTKRICKDKEYTYELFKNYIKMPKTVGYLDPNIQESYSKYIHFPTNQSIVDDINKNFSYPLIIKRNSGSQGRNVFEARNEHELKKSLVKIFEKEYLNYDYALIIQEKINIKQEFRAVILNHKIELLYLKDTSNAKFKGNLSPLHWENSRSEHITDQNLINKIQDFVDPIFKKLDLQYGGLDIAIDLDNQLWLIEANSHPFFDLFIKDNGDEEIVGLYVKMLGYLFLISKS